MYPNVDKKQDIIYWLIEKKKIIIIKKDLVKFSQVPARGGRGGITFDSDMRLLSAIYPNVDNTNMYYLS